MSLAFIRVLKFQNIPKLPTVPRSSYVEPFKTQSGCVRLCDIWVEKSRKEDYFILAGLKKEWTARELTVPNKYFLPWFWSSVVSMFLLSLLKHHCLKRKNKVEFNSRVVFTSLINGSLILKADRTLICCPLFWDTYSSMSWERNKKQYSEDLQVNVLLKSFTSTGRTI